VALPMPKNTMQNCVLRVSKPMRCDESEGSSAVKLFNAFATEILGCSSCRAEEIALVDNCSAELWMVERPNRDVTHCILRGDMQMPNAMWNNI